MAANRRNITADGNYTINWDGGEAYFSVEGTLGGGTYKLQVSQTGTNWTDSDVTFTAAGGERIKLGAEHLLRCNVASSTGADAYISLDPIKNPRVR